MAQTLVDKIWAAHFVARRPDGRDLVYVDRHVLHEMHGPHAIKSLEEGRRPVRRADLTIGVLDHSMPTRIEGPGARAGSPFVDAMRETARRHDIRILELEDSRQGIVHVISPELGLALPGLTLACPDSHSATVGGVGCLAFICGTTETQHVLATQCVAVPKPRQMRVRLEGKTPTGVGAKDLSLHLIRKVGVAGGTGHAVEYAGQVVRDMPIEQRFTLCNLTVEFGGRTGIVAPDEKTFEWCAGRAASPQGSDWEAAMAFWRTLYSDEDATFDHDIGIDCSSLEPQVTWGTDPSQVIGITERVPAIDDEDDSRKSAHARAIEYMDLRPGAPIIGLRVDRVFIGSCTESRLDDLRKAAALVRGHKVAGHVKAMIVPGSTSVKTAAEAEGLDILFREAGFEWHNSGCSMCAGSNGDLADPGERCISTSNRNFENRQGRGVRTHLSSAAMAAAAAIAGSIVDVRAMM